jgi:hypothetical protein
MTEFLREDNRFLNAFQRLLRIAETPEDETSLGSTARAGIMPAVEKCMRAMLLGIV